MTLTFPEGFLWGSSTSAAQVETPSDHNWRGFVSRDGYRFDRTTDHEKRREEDLGYIRQFGQIYRGGVDWARLQRAPYAPFDAAVTDEYVQFFRALNEAGMSIMLVLHHFTHPNWMEQEGGWQNESAISYYVDYARQCIDHFGPYVRFWNTFNEPNVYAMNAFMLGNFPPRQHSYFKANRALRYMGQAHSIAYEMIKERYPNYLVSISINTAWFEGIHPLGRWPAALADWWFHRKAPGYFTKVDFWGLSYYAYVPFNPFPLTEIDNPGELARLNIPHDGMWGYRPEGLGRHLRDFWQRYRKPVFVVESGICTDDAHRRIQAIKDYLAVCHGVLEEGVPLMGFIHWSTWDNFEWNLGPTYRFGLVRVDLKTKDRTMTLAGEFFARVCRENRVEI